MKRQFTVGVRDLAIGDQVSHFRLVKLEACGRWIAERTEHFRQRVWIEAATGAESEQQKQRIFSRIRSFSRLKHNCIPGLIQSAFLDSEGRPFVVFEFAEGTPLLVWAKEKRLPVREAVRLALECVDGLVTAHRQLVAHGGLDSDSFWMDDAGHPRLPVFPLDDARENPVRDDMKQIAEFLTNLLSVTGERIPPDMEEIISRCRSEAVNAHYESCDALAEDLRNFLEYRPISGSSGNKFHQVSLFARRRPGVFYPFTLSVMALLFAVGWSLWMEHLARGSQRDAESRLRDLHQLTISLESDLYQSVRLIPGSEPAQENLIRWSEDSLDRLALNAGGNPALRRELAADYVKLAGACRENGLMNEAVRLNRKGAAMMEQTGAAR